MKIVISVVLALFLVGCGEDTSNSSTQTVTPKEVKAVEVAEVVKKEVVAEAVKVEQEVKEIVKEEVVVAKTAQELYKACAGCHGKDGGMQALGKSKIIKGWDVAKTTQALNGYKDGTYGGAMKGLMKGQVSKLNDADIKVLAEYILTL
ncbi:MAG: c-type cytochrome [Campylobacterota bacterium]|nr:c-type cytochrome [Campylobacterota bacterium]